MMARPRSGAALVQRQKETGRRAQQQEEGLVRGAHGPSLSPLASSWPASSTRRCSEGWAPEGCARPRRLYPAT